MRREILAVALLFLSIESCKKAENPVNASWELSGKIVYAQATVTYVLDLGTPNPQPRVLVEGGGEPRVSADRKTVVFSMISPQGSFDIYSIGIDGSNVKNLTNRAWIMESWAELSPDGNWIIFTGDIPGYERLYIMDFYGKNIEPITDTSYFAAASTWSPTGTAIAFIYRLPSNPDIARLRTISPEGLYMVDLDSASFAAGPPLWSPDGHWIIYAHMSMPSYICYSSVINIDTHVHYPLNPDSMALFPFRWRQDGSVLAAGSKRGDTTAIREGIYRVTLGPHWVTAIQKIVDGFRRVLSIVESPDGRYVGIFGSWQQDSGCYFYVYDTVIHSLRKACEIFPETNFYMDEYYTQWIR